MEFLTEVWHCLKKLEIIPLNKVLTMKQDEAFEALIKHDIFGSVMSSSSLSGCSFYIFLSQVYSVSGFFKLS